MIHELVDAWQHPGETPAMRARRRYLEALRRQQPFAALRSSGVPDIRAIHEACGLRHLSWEYCPTDSPKVLRIGRVELSS